MLFEHNHFRLESVHSQTHCGASLSSLVCITENNWGEPSTHCHKQVTLITAHPIIPPSLSP